jgi:hypothetical protein
VPRPRELPSRIVSLCGRPRLDSNAWVAGTFQIFRARPRSALFLGLCALAPSWWLADHPLPDDLPTAPHLLLTLVPLLASLLAEALLLVLVMHTLAGRRASASRLLLTALTRLPAIAAAILLRTLAWLTILALALLAADTLVSSTLVLSGLVIALGISSSTLSPVIALCERASPLRALAASARLTHDLRLTVLKSRLKLFLLITALGLLAGAVHTPPLRDLLQRALEALWFSLGAILTAVAYLHLRARSRRQRLETAAAEISAQLT